MYDTGYHINEYYATGYYLRDLPAEPQVYIWGGKEVDDEDLILILTMFYAIIN
jgi:hypothetical protein